eukprot:3347561-Lingulodinium_polyedra.AAC.1
MAKGNRASTTLCLAVHEAEPTLPESVDPVWSRATAVWESAADFGLMVAAWRRNMPYLLRPE